MDTAKIKNVDLSVLRGVSIIFRRWTRPKIRMLIYQYLGVCPSFLGDGHAKRNVSSHTVSTVSMKFWDGHTCGHTLKLWGARG